VGDGIELPAPNTSRTPIDALQLLINSLDFACRASATEDLEKRIGKFFKDGSIPNHIHTVTVGIRAVDYCTMQGGSIQEMEATRRILVNQLKLEACWSPCSEPDRSRQLTFTLDILSKDGKDETKMRETFEKAML